MGSIAVNPLRATRALFSHPRQVAGVHPEHNLLGFLGTLNYPMHILISLRLSMFAALLSLSYVCGKGRPHPDATPGRQEETPLSRCY